MMSLETIRDMDWHNAFRAYDEGRKPLTFSNFKSIELLGKRAQPMGSYVPENWELTHRIFVDKGWGGHARSIEEVIGILGELFMFCESNFGVALSHEGQFQIHLDIYFRTRPQAVKYAGLKSVVLKVKNLIHFVVSTRKQIEEAKGYLSSEREVYPVSDDFYTSKNFKKVFRWTCDDCGEDCACPAEDEYPTCENCGVTRDMEDVS